MQLIHIVYQINKCSTWQPSVLNLPQVRAHHLLIPTVIQKKFKSVMLLGTTIWLLHHGNSSILSQPSGTKTTHIQASKSLMMASKESKVLEHTTERPHTTSKDPTLSVQTMTNL